MYARSNARGERLQGGQARPPPSILSSRPRRFPRGGASALLVVGGALAVVIAAVAPDPQLPWLGWDARAYWEAARSADPYANARVGELGAFLYSPAFPQVLRPVGWLPWPVFLYLWAAAGIAVSYALAARASRRWRWLWIPLAGLALLDVWAGNVNVLIAGAVVLGFRWPAAWSFLVLTKVTPGIGLLWFGFRREWGKMAIALATTAGVVALSALVDPRAWLEWLAVLFSNVGARDLSGDLAVPAVVRFPLAITLIAWGARHDRRWVLPLACLLLLPVIWPNGLAILLASAALIGDRGSARRAAVSPMRGVRFAEGTGAA